MKSFAGVAASLLLLSASLLAAGPLEGTFAGSVGDGESATPISMVMKHADDGAVSGSIIGVGSEMSIVEGVLAGNTLTFKTVQFQNDGSQLPMHCIGTLTIDSLNIACTTDGDLPVTSEFTVTRQAQ